MLVLFLMLGCAAQKPIDPPRTATVRIVARDTTQAVDPVTRSVQALGGHVASSESWREGETVHARVTLHVPRGSLTPALQAVRPVADRVARETVSNEDFVHHCGR